MTLVSAWAVNGKNTVSRNNFRMKSGNEMMLLESLNTSFSLIDETL